LVHSICLLFNYLVWRVWMRFPLHLQTLHSSCLWTHSGSRFSSHPVYHTFLVTPCIPHVSRHTLYTIRFSSHPVYHTFLVTPCIPYVSRHTLFTTRFSSHPVYHTFLVTPCIPYVSRHTLYTTRFSSHPVYHTFLVTTCIPYVSRHTLYTVRFSSHPVYHTFLVTPSIPHVSRHTLYTIRSRWRHELSVSRFNSFRNYIYGFSFFLSVDLLIRCSPPFKRNGLQWENWRSFLITKMVMAWNVWVHAIRRRLSGLSSSRAFLHSFFYFEIFAFKIKFSQM
jgi:hypothetical protein